MHISYFISQLENFYEKNGVKACIVSAVDLLKGIAICSGAESPDVAGTTGYIDTDFEEVNKVICRPKEDLTPPICDYKVDDSEAMNELFKEVK